MEILKEKKTAYEKAQRVCNKNCGEDYCGLANDGDECPAKNTFYCCNCDVGFITTEDRAICPYCGFDNTEPEEIL